MNDKKRIAIRERLMSTVGLEIVNGRVLYDQDYMIPFRFEANRVFVTSLLNPRDEMLFDLFEDNRIIKYVFQYYITKLTNDSNRSFLNYWTDEGDDKTIRCCVKELINNRNVTVASNFYYSELLAYLDLTIQIEGSYDYDLRAYDEKIENR